MVNTNPDSDIKTIYVTPPNANQMKTLEPYFEDGVLNLQNLVIDIDTQLIEDRIEPHYRPIRAAEKISELINIPLTIGTKNDKLMDEISGIYKLLYRENDLFLPPLHVGTFLFRDIYLPIRIPVFFGKVSIEAMSCLQNVPENILKWIQKDDEVFHSYIDQWIDLSDFVIPMGGEINALSLPEKAIEFFLLSKQHLESSAATLLSSINKYAATQNSIIAIELLFKALLLSSDKTEEELKKLRHNIPRLANECIKAYPNLDKDRVMIVAERTPNLVETRYEAQNFSRVEIGSLLMDAQYLAGEVMRQLSKHSIRTSLSSETSKINVKRRQYPLLEL